MGSYNENPNTQLLRKKFDINKSELGSVKELIKLINEMEIDKDFEWLLRSVIGYEDKDENDNDPQYEEFLKNLSENGKSYKLEIFKNNETSHFLKYEEREELDGHEYDPPTCEYGTSGDKADSGDFQRKANGKEVVNSEVYKIDKINEHKTMESGYQLFLNNCIPDKYGAYNLKGTQVQYEDNVTSDDSDIEILEIKNFNEIEGYEHPVPAKEESLKEKLIHILRKPYNRKEYKQLLEYLEEKKPICRLLPLRQRAISSALEGEEKSNLDDAPGRFRRKLEAAKREGQRPKALNLMRMYCFWLENLPNEHVFKPWLDKECLEVQPLPRTK